MEQFWGKRESGFTNTELAARKKRKSDEMANMNRVEYSDRKEKKRTWRAVKNVEVASSMTLQMRSETAESQGIAGSVGTEQKFDQRDEEMEM